MPTFCPDCDAVIPLGKFQCKCGGKVERPQRWLSKEEVVVNDETQKKAEAFCNGLGLCTTDEKREYIRKMLPQLSRPKTLEEKRAWMLNPKSEVARQYAEEYRGRRVVVEREPGQDDEERMAA